MLAQRYPGPVNIKPRHLELLKERTVINESQFAYGLLTDNYEFYEIHYDDVTTSSSDVTFQLEVSTDGGSTWESTSYLNRYWTCVTGTTSVAGLSVTGSFPLALRATTSGNNAVSGMVRIIRPALNGSTKVIGWSAHTDHASAAATMFSSGSRPVEETNAIRFVMSTGNIYGNFRVYGLKVLR